MWGEEGRRAGRLGGGCILDIITRSMSYSIGLVDIVS